MALKLRFLRQQTGMTLERLAADSGLTRSYLSKVERGLSTPSIESALKIAAALGVTVDRLFGREPDEEMISIVRANSESVADSANHLSLVAGINPERVMRAFIVRPGERQRGRIMSHHEGEEILFIISGMIEMKIGQRKEVLKPGDCVQFDSTLPHKLTALPGEPASALVIVAATDRAS